MGEGDSAVKSERRSRSRSPRRSGGGRERKTRFSDAGGGSSRGGGGGRARDPARPMNFDRMVFISNIPYTTRWMELKDLVREKCGDVAFVELLETQSGEPKGCAVIEFRDNEGAETCHRVMDRMDMDGRLLVVKRIREPEKFFAKVKQDIGVDFLHGSGDRPEGGGERTGGRRGGGGGGGGAAARVPRRGPSGGGAASLNLNVPFETYGLSPVFLSQLGIDGVLTNRIFVANLAFTLSPGRIKDIFGVAGKVNDVDLYLDKDGRSKGIAVVEYSHPIEAVQAISMLNNQRHMERTLVVKMDRHDKQPDRRPGDMPPGLSNIGMGLGANGSALTNVQDILAQQQMGMAAQQSAMSSNPFGAGVGMNSMMTAQQQQQAVMQQQQMLSGMNNINSQQPTALMGGGGSAFGGGGNTMTQQQPSFGGNMGGGNTAFGSNQSAGNFGAAMGNSSGFGMGGGGGDMGGGGGMGMGGGMGQMMGRSDAFGDSGMMARSDPSPVSATPFGGAPDYIDSRARGASSGQMDSGAGAWRSVAQGQSSMTPKVVNVIVKNLPPAMSWQSLKDTLRKADCGGNLDRVDQLQTGTFKIVYTSLDSAKRAAGCIHNHSYEGRMLTADIEY